MHIKQRNKTGFTLMELLVVVLIIGILAAVALPQYKKSVEKAKFTKYIGWARRIYHAQNEYYISNGEWGKDFSSFSMDFPSGTRYTGSGVVLPSGQGFNYNKNNTSVQFSYKDINFTLYLTTGKLVCYHYANATKKAFCKKVSKSCGINDCLVIEFDK